MNEQTANPIQTLKAHISINVSDVARSVEFYQKLFGIAPLKVRRGYAKFDVQNPPLNLAMNEATVSETAPARLSHLGIQVGSTSDVLAIKQRWEAAGLATRDEMQTSCCYAVQDKTWVADPDGNEWEVFVVLEDQLPETAEHGASSCCVPQAVQIEKMVQLGAQSCATQTRGAR